MEQFVIRSNPYLKRDIRAFYHTDYVRYQKPGNPDYINILKNTYNTEPLGRLKEAARELANVLFTDLPQIQKELGLKPLVVCVVPRAKAESNYHEHQLLFRKTVRWVVNRLDGFVDGTHYITRHTNTRTKHLPRDIRNYNNDGPDPYPGITIATCHISNEVMDKDILLVDDVYTQGFNIDEDAIQALLDKGARSVVFYAVSRTKRIWPY